MRPDAYWLRRAWERMLDIELMGNGYVDRIMRLYLQAAAQIEADMLHLFRRYRDQGALTPEEAVALLREPVDRATWDLLRQQIDAITDDARRRQLLAEMNAASVRARLNRQQALLLDLRARCAQLAQRELPLHTEAYRQTADEAYLRTVFDTLQEAADRVSADPQIGEGPAPVTGPEPEASQPGGTPFVPLPQDDIDDLLAQRWSGKNYSECVWDNTDAMAEHLAEVMRTNMTTGRSWRRCLDEMRAFAATPGQGALYAAERLLRTEQNYVANQMALRAMRDMGALYYRYIATLDVRTSEICQQHDGRIDPDTGKPYEVAKAKPGVNIPPLHPNCRSTVAAVVDSGVVEGLQRALRDPVTGDTVMVPGETTYLDWKRAIFDDELNVVQRKKVLNRSKDEAQYDQYRDRLAGIVPKSLDEFQQIKYAHPDQWGLMQAQYKGMGYYEKAVQAEPEITRVVAETAKEVGLDQAGLKKRIKGKESYLRKIATNYSPGGTTYEVKDILRYTYTSGPQSLAQKTNAAIVAFDKRGYNTFAVKNTWLIPNASYKGINTNLRGPDGQAFELQYHTQESFDLKDGKLHELYEKVRVLDPTSAEALALEDEMIEFSSKLTVPDGIEEVISR